MRPLYELFEGTFAADPGEPDGSMHRAKRLGAKSGFLDRGTAGLFHFGKRAVDAEAQRGRAGNAGAKHYSFRVLYARATSRAAAVDADEQGRL